MICAEASEKEKANLLGESVAELEEKLKKASDQQRSISFMPATYRNDLLEDLKRLRDRLEEMSPEFLAPATRLRTLYVLGWGYDSTGNRPLGLTTLQEAISLGEQLHAGDPADQNVLKQLAACHALAANLLRLSRSYADAQARFIAVIRLLSEEVSPENAKVPEVRAATRRMPD